MVRWRPVTLGTINPTLFIGNTFVGSATVAEVCTLLSAIPVLCL